MSQIAEVDEGYEKIATDIQIVGEGIDKLKTENARLKEFARLVIESMWDGASDVYGGDVQDWAEKRGLIVPREATEDDVAAGVECEVGDEIFTFSDWMQE